jgi:tRNA A37 threonylcarbamoyladenosine synthetase subunit TsaC/SUA5/YrdC
MGDRLPLILDGGETAGTLASTIVKLDDEDWTVMREGVISNEQIRVALEEPEEE